jgi:hypothetical protein
MVSNSESGSPHIATVGIGTVIYDCTLHFTHGSCLASSSAQIRRAEYSTARSDDVLLLNTTQPAGTETGPSPRPSPPPASLPASAAVAKDPANKAKGWRAKGWWSQSESTEPRSLLPCEACDDADTSSSRLRKSPALGVTGDGGGDGSSAASGAQPCTTDSIPASGRSSARVVSNAPRSLAACVSMVLAPPPQPAACIPVSCRSKSSIRLCSTCAR